MSNVFAIDARIKKDSVFISALSLCDVRLMQEQRWFWLVLLPRVKGAEEIFDLTADERRQLMEETSFVAQKLQQAAPSCDKINIGALGNIVHQLHIHIIARVVDDAAWPGPIWGYGEKQVPGEQLLNERLVAIKSLLEN